MGNCLEGEIMTVTETSPEIWEKLLEYLETTKDFVIAQSPSLLQETMNYHKISNFILATVCLIGIFVCAYIAYYNYMYPTIDKYDNVSLVNCMAGLFSCVGLLPCIGIFIASVDHLIKIYVAPKYFLIEKIREML
jgi:hypothetical protein